MRRLAPVLTLLGVLGFAAPAAAQDSFSLAPVVLGADPTRSLTTSVTFTNTSTRTVKVEASVTAWTMLDGQHTEAPTRDLLLNPPTFMLTPGESQLVRVGLRRKPTPGELTYRLHLDQRSLTPVTAPAPAEAPTTRGTPDDPASAPEIQTQIEQLFSVTLPIYFTPGGTAPKLVFALRRDGAGDGADLSLSIQNAGNRHETLYDLTLTRAGQTLTFPPNAVLAGGQVNYRLSGWGNLSGEVELRYRDSAKETVHVTPTLP